MNPGRPTQGPSTVRGLAALIAASAREAVRRVGCALGRHAWGGYTPWRWCGTGGDMAAVRRRERSCPCGAVQRVFTGSRMEDLLLLMRRGP